MYLLKSLINKIKKKKKAVSPLIATIVLISFTIAIGSLVINWGKQFITAQTQGLQQAGVECQKENAEIKTAIFNSNDGSFKFVIRNMGDIDLNFQSLNVYYKDGSVETVGTFSDADKNKCGKDSSTDCTVKVGVVTSFTTQLSKYKNEDKSIKKIQYIEIPSSKCTQNLYYYYNVQQ